MERLQPVRSANYQPSATVSRVLTLPTGTEPSRADLPTVLSSWSAYLGGDMPLLLVRDVDQARRLLMQAAGVAPDEPVGLPANCRRAQSEAVKRAGGKPHFLDLSPDLRVAPETPGFDQLRLLWVTPIAGSPANESVDCMVLVDYSESLPAPGACELAGSGAALLWGLHLGREGERATEGALIAFRDFQLYRSAKALVTADDLPDLDRALAQCERLNGPDGLAARQLRILDEVRFGMEAGAGLTMKPEAGVCALPRGLAVRIPDEADVATFISYVRNENIVIDWLPEFQPMFYVVYQVTPDRELTFQTAANLARWVISPLGPDFDDEQIVHAVLGILKAAEYTGVRWYTDPERAAWYGNLMLEWYGTTHDAYRPAFLHQSPDGAYSSDRLP